MLRSMLTVFVLLGTLSMFAACGGDDGGGGGERQSILGECPAGADTAAGQAVFTANCQSCHAGFATTRSATPAAATTSCSNLATIADCMYHRAMEGEMPPAPMTALSDTDVEALRVWMACNQ
jgi:cytochrome c5